MDTFVPPGYIAAGKLVELAGNALLKDEWLAAEEPPLSREDQYLLALEADWKRRDHRARSDRAAGQLRYSEPPAPLAPEIVAKIAAIKRAPLCRAEERQRQRLHVIQALRTALYTGVIRSVIKTSFGNLLEVEPYFWGGDGAIPAFLTGAATIYLGHGLKAVSCAGQALFKASETQEWLAGPAGGIDELETSRRRPPVANLINFLLSEADGTKTEAQCKAAAEEHFKGPFPDSKNLWREAWRQVPDEKKVARGRNPIAKSGK